MKLDQVKSGSVWGGSDGSRFRVIDVVELDGHTWVHYRNDRGSRPVEECKEYSCYIESFISRFTLQPE